MTGLVLLQPVQWFRTVHMADHRFTNQPGNVRELAAQKPATVRQIARHLATPAYWRDKLRVLWRNAFADPQDACLSDRVHRVIRRESRAKHAIYASLALVRFLAKNMPYRTEHHAWPTVSFHRLRDLHALMKDELRVTSPPCRAFTRDYLRGLER